MIRVTPAAAARPIQHLQLNYQSHGPRPSSLLLYYGYIKISYLLFSNENHFFLCFLNKVVLLKLILILAYKHLLSLNLMAMAFLVR